MTCSHDVGQAINRKGLEGQIEGGVTQGIGYALVEEMCFEGGALSNGTLIDYKIPCILDAPRIDYLFIELGDPYGPFGAKGVAESVLVPTAPAIANAVFDAIGVRITDLPITPEKSLRKLPGTGFHRKMRGLACLRRLCESPVSLDISQGRTVRQFSFEQFFEDQPIGREMETEARETPCP